jgi:hypothetical protein
MKMPLTFGEGEPLATAFGKGKGLMFPYFIQI